MKSKNEDFLNLAKSRYGDKVIIKKITYKGNARKKDLVFAKAVKAYPEQAWVKEGICPECDAELGGLFGTFTWSIIHGIGYCALCEKTEFRFYHYPLEESNQKIMAFALIGFPKEKERKQC